MLAQTSDVAFLIAGATLALVVPLAIAPTTFEQRAALAVLVVAMVVVARRHGWPIRLGRRLAVASVIVVSGILVLTAPAAARSERAARASIDTRAGERSLALGLADRAVERFAAAEALAPGGARSGRGLAAAHLALAEAAVAPGLGADRYRIAGDHLAAALASDPSNQAAVELSEAVAAIRQADAIWNQYDWPRTIGELRKAEAHRPDLPGLADKLRDAELSRQAAEARR